MDANLIRPVGQRLRLLRAGIGRLAVNRPWLADLPHRIALASPAFAPGHAMPVRHTQDGAGLSPPLRWQGLPPGTASLLLLVEDADIPLPVPLVHALAYDIDPAQQGLAEGALPIRLRGRAPEGFAMGRNGYARTGWIPPSPPPGHGPHHYAFQVFALAARPRFAWPPGRQFALRAARPHMLGCGTLFGVYERP